MHVIWQNKNIIKLVIYYLLIFLIILSSYLFDSQHIHVTMLTVFSGKKPVNPLEMVEEVTRKVASFRTR